METKGEEERERIRRNKNGNHRFTIRFGAYGRGNDSANRKYAASDYGVLENAEKKLQS